MITKISNVAFGERFKVRPSERYQDKHREPDEELKIHIDTAIDSKAEELCEQNKIEEAKLYLNAKTFISKGDVIILNGKDSSEFSDELQLLKLRKELSKNPIIIKNLKETGQEFIETFNKSFLSALNGRDSIKEIKTQENLREKWAKDVKPKEVSSSFEVSEFLNENIFLN